MFCPTCGKPNPDDATFCASCGNVFPGRKGVAAATVPPPRAAATVPPRPGVTPPVGEVKAGLFAARYELLNVLGKGGMGVVYRAKDNELGEDIAIKLLQPQFTKDAHEVERFKREILTARKITHPNVIRIHDYGTNGEELFISMELLPGGTLADRIARGIPLADARNVALGIAEGLGAAHAKKVVHRDIKPHNVLFDEDGTPKLVDFGIARFATATRATRGFAGTPHYISPEQAKGEDATSASDIYSLGVLLFELFTGQLPFDADSLVALAVKHAQEPPPPPRKIRPDLPEAIEAIVLKCLEKDPAKRYATPAELAIDLRAVQIAGARPAATFSAPVAPLAPAAPIARPTGPQTPPSAGASRETPAVTPPPVIPAPASLRGESPSPAITPAPGAPNPAITPSRPTMGAGTPPKRTSGCAVGVIALLVSIGVGCGGLMVIGSIVPTPTPTATPFAIPDGDDDDDGHAAIPSVPIPGFTVAIRPDFTPPPVPSKGGSSNDIVSPYGWTFSPPSDAWQLVSSSSNFWQYRDKRGSLTLWVVYFPGGSVQAIRENGDGSDFTDPVSAAELYPAGDLETILGGKGVGQSYDGDLGEASLAGYAFSLDVQGGVVSVIGYGPSSEANTTKIRIALLAAALQQKPASPTY